MERFELYHEYAKPEAGERVGLTYGSPAWRKGIFWFGATKHLLLFVTLVKAGLPFEYQYADRFVSRDVFHWQSQSQNTRTGQTAQRILHHDADGREIHLFVRVHAGQKFTYLGECAFIESTGDRPFSVWWRLAEPIPLRFHVAFAVPPVEDAPFQDILHHEVGFADEVVERVKARDYSAPDVWGSTKQRIGAKVFRRQVLENFGGACCVDGMNIHELLDAAHINAWSEHPDTRLDPANGLALCVLHHRAFDAGFMHFAKGGRIDIAEPVRCSKNAATRLHLIDFHAKQIRAPLTPTVLHV